MRTNLSVVFIALVLLTGARASAQIGDGGPDPEKARVRIGPLMVNPSIALTNIGIDHNVFNDPSDKVPKEDFTLTITPMLDFWLRVGRTRVTAAFNEQINWFQDYASERSANTVTRLGWLVPGTRMTLKLDSSYINARERPGFEIDTRAARKEANVSGAYDVHAFSKSSIGVVASRIDTRFAEDAQYEGTNLATALNRVDGAYGLTLRQELTPLTTLTISALHSTSRFEFSPARDAASNSVNASAAFAPGALIKGALSMGYTEFVPADRSLPRYTGLIANVDLTYVLLGSTRFAFLANRGVQYSYDLAQPYYVQSRVGGSVAQQLFGPFDVQVRGDIAWLDYRDRAGAQVAVPDRTDRVTTIGAGVGIHIGKDLRLAFNVDQNNRDTLVDDHEYRKFLIGSSLTYGF